MIRSRRACLKTSDARSNVFNLILRVAGLVEMGGAGEEREGVGAGTAGKEGDENKGEGVGR